MISNKKYFKTISILLIISAIIFDLRAQSETQNNSQIIYNKVGEMIHGKTQSEDQGRGFHVIQISQVTEKYLFAKLYPNQKSQFLNIGIYMYRGTQKNPFKTCKHQMIDSCYIQKDLITPNSLILVVVECGQACQYDLNMYWSSLEHLAPGDKVKFMFSQREQKQVYHLQLEGKQFNQVRIIMKPQTKRSMFDKIKIFGKYGSKTAPNQNDYDFQSSHLWSDAEGIYLTNKEMKQKNIMLLVIGTTQTIYYLTCEVINQTTHDIVQGQILDQYLQPHQEASYHVSFKQNQAINYDQYTLKFSAFNGNMSVGFYMDKELRMPYLTQPFQYMSDAQYIFSKEQVQQNLTDGIYIKTKSFDRFSTYMIEFRGRSKIQAILITEHIYQFLQIDYQGSAFVYFNYFDWNNNGDQTTLRQSYTFTVHLINVKGANGVKFRVCNANVDACLSRQAFQSNSQQISQKSYDQIGTKKTFTLAIDQDKIKSINSVENRLVILMIVKNIESSSSIAAIQYYSQTNFEYLRQSRPIQTKLKMRATKFFKHTNIDTRIKQIKIHVNRISGNINVYKLRTDPRQGQNGASKQTTDILSFTDKLTSDPFYVIVQAEDEAIFSLNLQLVHQSQQHLSSISVSQDVQFKIKIPPLGSEVLQIHPVYSGIYFKYHSTGLVVVCQLYANKCKQQIPQMGNQGNITVQKFQGRNQMIMVRNPSQDKIVQFSCIYHSAQYANCETKKIGIIYSQTFTNGKCFNFPLTKLQEVQISINRMDLGNLHVIFFLCQKLVQLGADHGVEQYRIDMQTFLKNCQTDQDHKVLSVFVSTKIPQMEKNQQQKSNVKEDKNEIGKVKLSVQYTDQGGVLIPDGVGYTVKTRSTQSALKVFYYNLNNKIDTTIILANTIGSAYFTVKIAPTLDRHKYLDKATFDFSSTGTNYYFNPQMTITGDQLSKIQCKDCSLVIKVYSKQKLGTIHEFTLQVVQNFYVLEDHKMKEDFLTKDSFAYYSYHNKNDGNTIMIQTSDNNLKCTKIFLSDKEYPSGSNQIATQNGNQLAYADAQNKTYYIAIQAMDDCAYSVSVSSTKNHITKIQRGKTGYLKLEVGQVKHFMFYRASKKPFKVLSIHVYGQVSFYLNQSTPQKIAQLMNQDTIDYESFKIKGEYKNRLVMSDEDALCQNCYYILTCLAKKNTQSSIYLGDDESLLSISQNKSVNDLLENKDDFLKGTYYNVQPTKLKVKVHSGKLNLKVTYKDQAFEKVYVHLNDIYEDSYKLKRTSDDWTPSFVELTALQDNTVYSIRFTPDVNESQLYDETQIYPGQPNYLYLRNQKVNCLTGYLREKNQKIMITSDSIYQTGLQNLTIKLTMDQKSIQHKTQIVNNIMSISIPLQNYIVNQGKKYKICIKSEEGSFSATVFQTQDITVLPEDVESIVYGSGQYVIRPDGNFLMDVFECKGKASIIYSQSLKNLPAAQVSTLDILGMPEQTHAFKINQYLTTFINISSELAIVRWLPMDSVLETGMGYYNYKVGSLQYDSTLSKVQLKWKGLKVQKQTKTKIKVINYTIYVSGSKQNLQSAQNCQRYSPKDVMIFQWNGLNASSLGKDHSYLLQKSALTAFFPNTQNLFVNIAADVELQTASTADYNIEHYKFFYHAQEISKQIFRDDKAWLSTLMNIGLVVAIIIAFLLFTWICLRKIVPILARLKNRMLIQQQDQNKGKQIDDVPPPSSERKTIQSNLGTEDKMTQKGNQNKP